MYCIHSAYERRSRRMTDVKPLFTIVLAKLQFFPFRSKLSHFTFYTFLKHSDFQDFALTRHNILADRHNTFLHTTSLAKVPNKCNFDTFCLAPENLGNPVQRITLGGHRCSRLWVHLRTCFFPFLMTMPRVLPVARMPLML